MDAGPIPCNWYNSKILQPRPSSAWNAFSNNSQWEKALQKSKKNQKPREVKRRGKDEQKPPVASSWFTSNVTLNKLRQQHLPFPATSPLLKKSFLHFCFNLASKIQSHRIDYWWTSSKHKTAPGVRGPLVYAPLLVLRLYTELSMVVYCHRSPDAVRKVLTAEHLSHTPPHQSFASSSWTLGLFLFYYLIFYFICVSYLCFQPLPVLTVRCSVLLSHSLVSFLFRL